MQSIQLRPIKHILVCTNERTDGRECCSETGSIEIYHELKNFVREKGLRSVIWVTRTGCLGFCNKNGATIVVYPDQLWFKEVKKDELGTIKDLIMDSVKDLR